jgi:hypothetical protein
MPCTLEPSQGVIGADFGKQLCDVNRSFQEKYRCCGQAGAKQIQQSLLLAAVSLDWKFQVTAWGAC